MTTTTGKAPSERVKGGNSQATAAQRRAAFVEAYLANGGNATQAAISAGYSPKTAYSAGGRALKNVEVKAAIEGRQNELQQKHRLTTDRVLQELARLAYFDPRKLYDEAGNLKGVHQLDDDTAAAIASLDFEGGKLVKVRASDKNSALEKASRILGLYKSDLTPLVPPQCGGSITMNVTLTPSQALMRMLGQGGHAR